MPFTVGVKLTPSIDAAVNVDEAQAVVTDQVQAEGEDWSIFHNVPEPTKAPLDPLEVKLGRALTPDEYHVWLKDHVQPAGPQKRLNKPHVMSAEAYKQWKSTKAGLKPTPPPEEVVNQTVRFQKLQADIKGKAKDFIDNKVKPSIELYKQQVAQQKEEHEAWLAETNAEEERLEALRQKAANKKKERAEFMKRSAEQRKEKILAKEKEQEEYLKHEESKLQAEIDAEGEAMREDAAQERAMQQAKHWAEFHFVKAEVGMECPQGWTPVLNRTSCQLAQKVLGGIDDTNWNKGFAHRPSGCSWHTLNGHVSFNSAIGKLNLEDERICEKKLAASGGELKKQYRKVVAAEVEQQEQRKTQDGEAGPDGAPNFDLEAAESLEGHRR